MDRTMTTTLQALPGGKDTPADLLRDVRQRGAQLDATCSAAAARLAASAAASRAVVAAEARRRRARRCRELVAQVHALKHAVEREVGVAATGLDTFAQRLDEVVANLERG